MLHKRSFAIIALGLGIAALPASAAAEKYTIASDTKHVNVAFESRMDVEDIFGTTRTASGTVDLSASGGTFEITIPVASLHTGIDLRDEHLRSAQWLNAAKFPKITFAGTTIKQASAEKYAVTGTFTLRGTGKTLTAPVDVKRIPAATAAKAGLPAGNWMRIRATFKIKLSDHGIKVPSQIAAKVSDEWTIRVSLFAKEVK
jgi:polyisoprenoid-binding protein YceI